jgi:hypothetical protein
MHRLARLLSALAFAALPALAACSRTGLGDAVRKDITERIQTAQQPIAACYQEALTHNRKLRGKIQLSFTAAAGSGKFTDVQLTRDDLRDDTVRACVIKEVSALSLATPQKSAVSIQYPLDFAPLDQPQPPPGN